MSDNVEGQRKLKNKQKSMEQKNSVNDILDSLDVREDFEDDDDELCDPIFEELENNEEAIDVMRITPNNKEENLAEILDLYRSQLVETENYAQNNKFAPNMSGIGKF
jgi:hypothetical protein